MNAQELPVIVLVSGLLLAYLAIVLVFVFVWKGQTVPLSRRRPSQSSIGPSALNRVTQGAVGVLNTELKRRGSGVLTRATLDKAGLHKQPGDYLLIAISVSLVAGLIAILLVSAFFGLLIFVLSMGFFFLLLQFLIARRQRVFDGQVPDTLQMFSGGLRAGHSLLRAIDASAQEQTPPMAEELGRVITETRIGRDLGESLLDVANRTNNEDFEWMARAIEIHREVGGDLAEVLDHVGETIRDRNQVRRQVRALSAEGRISALVLIGLPIVMFFLMIMINPVYAVTFTSTIPGYVMIAGAALLLTLGALWINRMIKPKF